MLPKQPMKTSTPITEIAKNPNEMYRVFYKILPFNAYQRYTQSPEYNSLSASEKARITANYHGYSEKINHAIARIKNEPEMDTLNYQECIMALHSNCIAILHSLVAIIYNKDPSKNPFPLSKLSEFLENIQNHGLGEKLTTETQNIQEIIDKFCSENSDDFLTKVILDSQIVSSTPPPIETGGERTRSPAFLGSPGGFSSPQASSKPSRQDLNVQEDLKLIQAKLCAAIETHFTEILAAKQKEIDQLASNYRDLCLVAQQKGVRIENPTGDREWYNTAKAELKRKIDRELDSAITRFSDFNSLASPPNTAATRTDTPRSAAAADTANNLAAYAYVFSPTAASTPQSSADTPMSHSAGIYLYHFTSLKEAIVKLTNRYLDDAIGICANYRKSIQKFTQQVRDAIIKADAKAATKATTKETLPVMPQITEIDTENLQNAITLSFVDLDAKLGALAATPKYSKSAAASGISP